MLITRVSMFTRKTHTLDLPVTAEQMALYNAGNLLLQDCFPDLPKEYREFIKTGVTPEEWIAVFGSPDKEEEEELS